MERDLEEKQAQVTPPPSCTLGACFMLHIDLGPEMQCLGLNMDLRP